MPQQKFAPENSFLKTYKAELFLLLVTVTWGLSFPLIKISLNYISPVLFVFIRFFLTLIIFYLVYRKNLILSNYNEWKYGIILGIFLFSGFALQTIGLKFTSASKSAFITGITLIIIPFAQYLILKSKPKVENIIGAVIVLIGLYILSEAYFTIPNIGDIITLFCTFVFAIHIVLLDKYSRFVNFNYLVFGQFLMMVILSFIFMLVVEKFITNEFHITLNSTLIISLIFTSLFSTLIGIVLMTKYQRETTPLRAGIIYNMESVFAVLFAFILLEETLNLNQLIGVIIMFIGLMISEFYGLIKFKLTNANRS